MAQGLTLMMSQHSDERTSRYQTNHWMSYAAISQKSTQSGIWR